MSETLWGVVIGGVLGIAGTAVAGFFTAREARSRRRRDHEIKQIANTVEILDKWEEYAMAVLGGDPDKIAAAGAALRDTDKRWDWDVSLIPGARELHQLAIDIGFRGVREEEGRPFELSSRLIDLQGKVRTNGSRRTRELQ